MNLVKLRASYNFHYTKFMPVLTDKDQFIIIWVYSLFLSTDESSSLELLDELLFLCLPFFLASLDLDLLDLDLRDLEPLDLDLRDLLLERERLVLLLDRDLESRRLDLDLLQDHNLLLKLWF